MVITEVLHVIFEYLDDYRDWVSASSVCQRWRQVATSNQLWLPLLRRYNITESDGDGGVMKVFAAMAKKYPGALDEYAIVSRAVKHLQMVNPSVCATTENNMPYVQLFQASLTRPGLWQPTWHTSSREEKMLMMLYHLFTDTAAVDMQLCCAACFGFFVCYNDVYALHLKRRLTVDVLPLYTQQFDTLVGFAWAPGMDEGLGLVLQGELAGHVVRYGKALRTAHRMGPIWMNDIPYQDLGPFETWLSTFAANIQGGVRRVLRANDEILAPSGFLEVGPGVGSVTTHGINVHVSTLFLLNMARVAYRITFTFMRAACKYSSVQLVRRHWIFRYTNGQAAEVDGDGVVGFYPTLSATNPHFSYCSYSDGGVVREELGTLARATLENCVTSLQGWFQFVPGSLTHPEGPELQVTIPFVQFVLPMSARPRIYNE
ncbi:hypothetical protein ACHHYP_13036 [Achlya hypogyna]|uniref:ApaG domain-containing protein n=1 Tax=Achlya hypogyna TaxID=1202772 RepID=A0A1V9YG69_ACHHY|nr:hypothetical protein ACHHYP_13036 [Achlya hypogyna]